jgi:hypothetical protein
MFISTGIKKSTFFYAEEPMFAISRTMAVGPAIDGEIHILLQQMTGFKTKHIFPIHFCLSRICFLYFCAHFKGDQSVSLLPEQACRSRLRFLSATWCRTQISHSGMLLRCRALRSGKGKWQPDDCSRLSLQAHVNYR